MRGEHDVEGEPTGPEGTFVQSLARGLAVIKAFDADRPDMSLSEVATVAGLTRAAARRFLLTLVELGYVRHDGRRFALTPRVLELGFSYLAGLGLPEIAQPHLERLSRELNESTSASVLDGDDIVYVARVPTRRIMTVGITIGTRFPAYATSMGRVLLAALPEPELARRLAAVEPREFTPETLTAPDALAAEIHRVRSQGWSLVDQELELGLRSVAVAVHQNGTAIAAVNVSTTSASSLARLRDEFVPALRATAAAIADDLARSAGTAGAGRASATGTAAAARSTP
ncbi:IclR family transcriptional regulator C-terminal domain-containing protein [Herbiconiux sp. KACC 21604]|uniref:IclR family transcriptional regulator domain-containing protein n=1 Tax=unclassified Herbiconiux TaxID=2618217 RepID=UPI0014913E2C|nr:IclR family transcriptional regulator C-terminal domain-containing protein [Herbiconiux sp. SALV-R1]QJU52730.1 helix-turn-helix domain-containing protein [Herbiconiux sp. SALV-R1]WPO87631.1 IclR family transcriptional regulator C-terminal domain-containing protein [Herbiconiux sp. KACC 21604]